MTSILDYRPEGIPDGEPCPVVDPDRCTDLATAWVWTRNSGLPLAKVCTSHADLLREDTEAWIVNDDLTVTRKATTP